MLLSSSNIEPLSQGHRNSDSKRKATICHALYSVGHRQMVSYLPQIEKKSCVCAPEHPDQPSLSLFMQVWLFCWGCQDQQINTDIDKQAMLSFGIPCIYHFIPSQESVESKKKIKEPVTSSLSGVSSESHSLYHIFFYFPVQPENSVFQLNAV